MDFDLTIIEILLSCILAKNVEKIIFKLNILLEHVVLIC